MLTEKTLVRRIRYELRKVGCTIRKSRRSINADNLGGYMIVDLYGNYVVAGSRFELSLKDVQDWIGEMC